MFNPSKSHPSWTGLGRIRSNLVEFGRHRLASVDIGQEFAHLDPEAVELGHLWSNPSHIRSNSASFGRSWPIPANIWSNPSQVLPNSAKFGRARPNLVGNGPNLVESGFGLTCFGSHRVPQVMLGAHSWVGRQGLEGMCSLPSRRRDALCM